MTITPEQAKDWLDSANKRNRPLRATHYMALGIDMLEGRWKYNGDAVRFGTDGVLLDGQHRLMACVDAHMPFETDVIFGLDPNVMPTIDIPRVRTAGDVAHLQGVENASQATAIANLLLLHTRHGIQNFRNSSCRPTKTQITQEVMANPRIALVAGRTGWRSKRLVAPRILGFCHYLFSEQKPDLAERFLVELTEGTNLSKNNPVYLLRERLRTNSASKAKLPPLEIIALFFKAWTAYRDGERIRLLRWSSKESFPNIAEGKR
jgi:hypothetical protein